MTDQSLLNTEAELAALRTTLELTENDAVRERIRDAKQALADSRSDEAAENGATISAVAATWFGALSVDLAMLALVTEQTAGRTGIQLTGMEKMLLTEARSLRSLKTPEEVNAWISVRSQTMAVADPRAFEAIPAVYTAALGATRVMLTDVLRILQRVGATFL